MKVTIDRSEWLRGEGAGVLYRPTDGKRCCLGFALKERGIDDETMSMVGLPAYLANHGFSDKCDWLAIQSAVLGLKSDTFINSEACREAAIINDHLDIDEANRETKIIRIFSENGDEVEFVG